MNNTFPQNVFVHCTLGTFHNHFCKNFESHFVIFKPQGKQVSCLWPKKGGRYTKRIPFFLKGVIQSTSDAKFWCTYILGYTLYSCFEKGCQKKCMRQSRKVLWVVFRSLVFKEISKNGMRGHGHIFVSAKGKQQKYVWQLQALGTVCWSYPILPFRLLHAHFWRQPFLKKLYTSLFASFLQLS